MTAYDIHLILTALVVLIVIAGLVWFYRHQCLLRERAHLMHEAIRNRDFTFHLPVKGLFFGERALQETVNNLSQDINTLVAQNEIESWQKLTRVLTHEIMNAAAPICSISQTFLSAPDIKGSVYEEGIMAIYQTSKGMSNFVENFRKITMIQEPVLAEVNLHALFESLKCMYPDVIWNIENSTYRNIMADEDMLRQVLINIVKNAIEAGATKMDVRYGNSLQISNNGTPIPADVAREIFIPFFTTKSHGSGIGLSLSRQMLIKQGMNLQLAERPIAGYHTTFVISI